MFDKSESRSKVTIASGKPSHMVDSGCCSRLFDPVRALRFFYSMFWDSVPCVRSIPMHCFLDGVRVGRSSTSRRVFGTFRHLPSRCCGSLFPLLLLRRFSVLLPHQADFDFVHSTVVAKRSHFAEVLSLVTVFWSLFLLMERDELGVSPSPHRMSRDSPLKGGLATPIAMSFGPLLPSELTSASFPTTTSLAYFQSRL